MLFLAPVALLLSTAISASAVIFNADSNSLSKVIPGRYIVEYTSTGSKRSDPHAHFETHMKRADISYTVARQYDSADLFVGASIAVDDANRKAIAAMPGVMAVYPVTLVSLPKTYGATTNIVSGGSANPTDTFSTHQMTGVDKLHNSGILGAGMVIGEIDTGIDYTHPALGGCYGSGCKVIGGYDFVGDSYTGENDPVPGGTPTDCLGHGTHVAGILAANDNPMNFTGVAPSASLRIYRVFGCVDSSANDVIMSAMIQAASDKVDVITMSLGGPAGWRANALGVVAARIVASGIPVVASAGNSGDAGLFYTSAPANGMDVISVASVVNTVTPGMPGMLSSGFQFQLSVASQLNISASTNFPIFLSSTDLTPSADACSAFPTGTDATGQVALVRRGSCSFATKAQNLYDIGVRIVLFYDNVDEALITTDIGTVDVKNAFISAADGATIKKAVLADSTITVSFISQYVNFPNYATGGTTSTFSEYGLTFDQFLQPSVGAPGENILSTWLTSAGSYNVISGTSMSCPFIAGVVALFIQHNGAMEPPFIKSILQGAAIPVSATKNSSTLQTVVQIGGGLVDAYTSVLFNTAMVPAEFALNDTDHAVTSSTFTITNTGTSSMSYSLSNLAAPAALTFSTNGNQPNEGGPIPLVDGAATVTFPGGTYVTVAAGGSTEITVNFAAPSGLTASNVPIYSGYIVVEAADQSLKYTLPYAGTAASMNSDYPIFDTQSDYYFNGYPIFIGSDDGTAITSTTTYTFANRDAPYLFYRLIGGTAKLYVDLVDSSTTFSPTLTKRQLSSEKMEKVVKREKPSSPTIVGSILEYDYNYRNDLESDEGAGYFETSLMTQDSGFYFSDGTKVPNGSYKVLLRGLKFFGSETDESQYESWLSPVITVNQA